MSPEFWQGNGRVLAGFSGWFESWWLKVERICRFLVPKGSVWPDTSALRRSERISADCHKTGWVSGHRCGNENYEEVNTRFCDCNQCLPGGTGRGTVETDRSGNRGERVECVSEWRAGRAQPGAAERSCQRQLESHSSPDYENELSANESGPEGVRAREGSAG